MAKRKPLARDLANAVTLRPTEVYALYGIKPSMTSSLANHPDADKRLPSILIPGRMGHRGVRLIDHAELLAYMSRWRAPLVDRSVDSPSKNAA